VCSSLDGVNPRRLHDNTSSLKDRGVCADHAEEKFGLGEHSERCNVLLRRDCRFLGSLLVLNVEETGSVSQCGSRPLLFWQVFWYILLHICLHSSHRARIAQLVEHITDPPALTSQALLQVVLLR